VTTIPTVSYRSCRKLSS